MNNDNNLKLLRIMFLYSAAAVLAGLILTVAGGLGQSLKGFWTILTSPAQLTVDYFKIGTMGGTFLNVGLVGLSCMVVFNLSGAALNSISLMSFFLTIGFSFYGINLFNIWPCFLGTYLFTLAAKEKFAAKVNIAMFATSLSPFVSEGFWRYPVFDNLPAAWLFKLFFGILLGVIAGFLMPALCGHSPNMHKGYTLYSAAAVAGLIGIMIYSTMYRAVGVEAPTNTNIGDCTGAFFNVYMIILSVCALAAGFVLNGMSFKGYLSILKSTGHSCGFAEKAGIAPMLINIGIFGLFEVGYYNLIGAKLTGPTAGCMICLLAVATSGAHCFNMLPIMIGYGLASTFSPYNLNDQALIVGLCYAGAMVPLSGCFGAVTGIVAGMLHFCMVTSVVGFHGGFCLYNSGFTSAITVILMVPVLEYFFVPSDRLRLLPTLRKRDAAA